MDVGKASCAPEFPSAFSVSVNSAKCARRLGAYVHFSYETLAPNCPLPIDICLDSDIEEAKETRNAIPPE